MRAHTTLPSEHAVTRYQTKVNRRARVPSRTVPAIEDLGRHSEAMVKALRAVFADPAHCRIERVSADPKRDGFYDLETRDFFFYFYVSPVTGRVSLLAARRRE